MRRSLFSLAAVAFFTVAAASTASAQDFQKTYRVGAGATINVRNVSGDVIVTGTTGDAVVVVGHREGRDADQVEVEDLSGPNSVDVRVRYTALEAFYRKHDLAPEATWTAGRLARLAARTAK